MEWFKKKMRVFLFVCLLFPFYSYAAKISLSISGKIEDHSAMLYFPDGRELPISIDASVKGELVVDVTEPVYVALGYHYISRTLLLTPDTDIQISFENKKFGERVAITGTGSQVNIYLNNGRLKAAEIDDMALGEKAFFLKMDSILNVNLQELDHAGLSEEINEMEKIRLKYFTCATLPSYPYFHMRIAKDSTYEASLEYWSKLQELMVMDASLLRYDEFRSFLVEAVSRVARKQYPESKSLDAVVRYVESEVKEPGIAEFLINKNVYAYVERYGLDSADAYCAVFDRYVKSPLLVKNFETLCNRWRKLSVGALSPNFNCTDLSGKKVSLSDFKGKYVYIDIWATWCGPCQREIPHLQKLEEKYHGKDIYFVSISCDNNKKAWENRVRAGLKGIQLHFVNGDTFMNDYMIKGIPRFILLDKEGKIISVDMSRPSDPKTIAKLDELLN